MLATQERRGEVAEVVAEPTLPGMVAGPLGGTSATFAIDVVPPREGTLQTWALTETGEEWSHFIAQAGVFISFAKSLFLSGVGIFRLEKPFSEWISGWEGEWKGVLGRFEERAPLLDVFDPLARSLSTEALLHEIAANSSGVTSDAAEVLREEPRLTISVRDILRRVGASLRRLAFREPPEVDAFSDPDAEGPPVLRIVARAPEGMPWEDQMRAWDRISELVDELLPSSDLKRRIIVSVEPG